MSETVTWPEPIRVVRVEAGDAPVFIVERSGGTLLLTLTRSEALDLAVQLIAAADRDAAEHVRAGPFGLGAELVERLRCAAVPR